MAKSIEGKPPRPYMVHITYVSDITLIIGCHTIEQVNDLVNGAHARNTGFYGFTDPGEEFPRVSFNREGILFIQVFSEDKSVEIKSQGQGVA